MMAKPIRALELLYPMIQFLIKTNTVRIYKGSSILSRSVYQGNHISINKGLCNLVDNTKI